MAAACLLFMCVGAEGNIQGLVLSFSPCLIQGSFMLSDVLLPQAPISPQSHSRW